MTRATILFADNDADFLGTRAEYLQNAGYQVSRAHTPAEARQLLAEAHIHLAILDIRLLDDDDERDTSGLILAKDPAYHPVPKIILTGFPTYQAVRKALGVALDGLPPAVDFLAKQEGPEAMIQAVERAWVTHVRINGNLQITWDPRDRLSFLYLAGLLYPDLPDDALVQRANDLQDLFRHLFYDYGQIRIGRLLWHAAGRLCLTVLAESAQGATDPRLLVCGERSCLEQELERMRELAPDTIRGIRLVDLAETMHFGAAAYTLPEAELETVQPLCDLFQAGRERPLKDALNHLLEETLVAWHQRGQVVDLQDLMTLYRQRTGLEGEDSLPRGEVELRADALIQVVRPLSPLEIERGEGTITFHFPKESPIICPDPVATAYAPLEPNAPPVVCKISPGRLTADNILVDNKQQTWVTDFAEAGQAPQWWDFVCLEAAVRFDLSQAPDLLAWQEFEESLAAPGSLGDRLQAQDVIAALRTNLALIEQIRRQAGRETGLEVLPYYAGLLVWAIGAIAQYEPGRLYTQAERQRGAHLLLAAALIARRLGALIRRRIKTAGSSAREQHSSPQLRLDEDGVHVWIGPERRVALAGQELALLHCLCEQAGQVVPRQVLVERVLKGVYDLKDKYQEANLNSLVRRLREKIEPNPDKPRYVLMVRGQGYWLDTGGPGPG